jgi:ribosomal protein S18 acetylase RimI-like enzyme
VIEVRLVGPGDRADWERLFRAYGEFYETRFEAAVLDGVWSWLTAPEHEVRGFVAVDDGRIVGIAHLRRLRDTFTAGTSWFLDDLYVDADARGRGAARALVEAVAAYGREHGGGTLRWITAADNTTAQQLYDRVATRSTWVTYEREV